MTYKQKSELGPWLTGSLVVVSVSATAIATAPAPASVVCHVSFAAVSFRVPISTFSHFHPIFSRPDNGGSKSGGLGLPPGSGSGLVWHIRVLFLCAANEMCVIKFGLTAQQTLIFR